MNNIIENRKKVYENLDKRNLEISLSDLVFIYKINNSDLDLLKEKTKTFILKTLDLVYNKKFDWTEDFLEKYSELLLNLPNKTPNGIINPRQETIFEFEEIQVVILKIIDKLEISKSIKKIAIPNIRFKSTNEDSKMKNRPFYTSKYHSDAWPGHVGDSILLVGILGDIDNNTVEFNEPIDVKENYLDSAESFDEGNTRYNSINYLGELRSERLALMDHACLHRTLMKNSCKPRISLDIAIIIDSEYSFSKQIDSNSTKYKYYDFDVMSKIGTEKNYTIMEKIDDDSKSTSIFI